MRQAFQVSAVALLLAYSSSPRADEVNARLDQTYISKLQGDIRKGVNQLSSGFKAATEANLGISPSASYGYDITNAPTAGCITPASGGSPSRLTSGTPSVPNGGTAANINDDNIATTVSWSPGNISGAAINSRIFAKIDYGANQTITKIEVKRLSQSLYSGAYLGVYYSTDGSTWTQLGTNFSENGTPTDFSQTGSVTARYVALIAAAADYASVQHTFSDLNGYTTGSTGTMTLVTAPQTSDASVSYGQITAEIDTSNAPVLNTDIVGQVSCAALTASATISYASPAIVSHTSHGLSASDPVSFAGTLPSPLVAGMTYFVKTVVDADHYSLAATAGGPAINTTSAVWGPVTASFRRWATASFSAVTAYSQAGRTVIQSADQLCLDAGNSWSARIKEPTGKATSIFALSVTVH